MVDNKPKEKLRQLAKDLGLQDFSKHALDLSGFDIWTGCANPKGHHYGKGGLAQHILEVCELAQLNNEYLGNPAPKEPLFLACLFHDVGKLWDYALEDEKYPKLLVDYSTWKSTDHKKKIHHITRSVLVFHEACRVENWGWWEGMSPDTVIHAILAHHCRTEWGSPIEPQTKLAWLLHLADNISARLDDGDRIGGI